MYVSLLAAVSLSGLFLGGSSAFDVSVLTSPPGTSKPLVSTLLSFSLEQDRWPDWAGTNAPNSFTRSALTNYAKLTGTPPKIRVGANSEDHTVWSPTVTINQDSFPPPNTVTPYPEATSITVGDGYYQLSRFMLPGTHMTWGLNLGLDNVTNAVNMAKSIIKAFGTSAVKSSGVTLDMLELGNEADLYKNNGLRPSQLVREPVCLRLGSPRRTVAAAAGLSKERSPRSKAAAFAGQGFTPTEIFNLGILNSTPGKAITTISQHRYSAAFCSGGNFPLVSFMNKANVRSNLTVFNSDVAASQQQGLRYVFGETGSIACHGAPGVSNTAGAALWVIDYTLQAATLGITEMFFHEGIGFKYNFFQPISLNRSIVDGSPLNPPQPAQVQPSYYAGILINTFVGNSGNAQIVELSVPDNNVSGYAAFEGGRLVRAVFVNLHAWLQSSNGTRPSVHIDFDLATRSGGAKAKRLVIGHADDTKGLTFGGQSFETSDASPSGSVVTENVDLTKGVDLRATEAILISF